jgi:hypothetical protein
VGRSTSNNTIQTSVGAIYGDRCSFSTHGPYGERTGGPKNNTFLHDSGLNSRRLSLVPLDDESDALPSRWGSIREYLSLVEGSAASAGSKKDG